MKNGPSIAVFLVDQPTHVGTTLNIVAELATSGCRVRVWTSLKYHAALKAMGVEVSDIYAGRTLDDYDNESRPLPVRFVTLAGCLTDQMAQEVLAWGADVILAEAFALIGRTIAKSLGLPWVLINAGHRKNDQGYRHENALISPAIVGDRFNKALARIHSLPQMPSINPHSYFPDQSPFLNIYLQPQEWLTLELAGHTEPCVYFGSLNKDQMQPVRRTGPTDRLRIYTAFGTVIGRKWGARTFEILQSIVRAASQIPNCHHTIALGGVDLPQRDRKVLEDGDVRLVLHAPQMEELSKQHVFVTHHGMNSTHEAVAARIPMLSIPFVHDQPALARRCQAFGLAQTCFAEDSVLDTDLTEQGILAGIKTILEQWDAMQDRFDTAQAWENDVIAQRSTVIKAVCALC